MEANMIQNKNVLFTIELYGFSGEYNRACNLIKEAIIALKPDAQALFINQAGELKDLEGESHPYIKIIYSSRRLALKLCQKLEGEHLFETCYVGIFPYQETFFPGKKISRRERKKTKAVKGRQDKS